MSQKSIVSMCALLAPALTLFALAGAGDNLASGPSGEAAAVARVGADAVSSPSAQPAQDPRESGPRTPGSPAVDFNRDIRPILTDRCFLCHGPDERMRKETGGFRLDSFDEATRDLGGGRHAIVPGHPEQSEILRRLRSDDPHTRMPPPDTKLSVSADETALIERWIASGAEYSEHWSFVPPTRPPLPDVSDPAWCRNAIDRFVLRGLDEQGIAPSEEADRETLARRLALDLTGLPLPLARIAAFVGDESPDAYERLVEELLASPHYGERLALMWLDVASYADTHGYHHDNLRSQWPWRDWVIRAFNENKPFDAFVTEQLAGDLLTDATPEQRIATGFLRNHPMTDEGGAIDQEYLVEYAADRVATTSTAFMALTMNCARCHDHKFDPLTMEDYYGLFAFFNSNEEKGLNDFQRGKIDLAFEPFMPVPSDAQRDALADLDERAEGIRAHLEGPLPELDAEQAAWEQDLRSSTAITWLDSPAVQACSEGGATLTVLDDGSVLASEENPARDTHVITLRTDGSALRVLRIEALADERLPYGRVGRAYNGNAVLTDVRIEAAPLNDPERTHTIPIAYAWASREQQNGDFGIWRAIDDDPATGWALDGHRVEGSASALLVAQRPFGFAGGTEVRVTLQYASPYDQHTLGRVRLSLASADEHLLDAFPVVQRDWFSAGPFKGGSADEIFARRYGPESVTSVVPGERFGEAGQAWTHQPEYADDAVNEFSGTGAAFYFGRQMFSPQERMVEVSLGSDDAVQVYVNGREVLANNTRRGAAADQERVTLPLRAGENAVVLKVVNDGGPGGFYYEARPGADAPRPLDPLALVASAARDEATSEQLRQAYRDTRSPTCRAMRQDLEKLEAQRKTLAAEIPNVMVMQEREEPRETFVLERGSYDAPDHERPVDRAIPAVFGALPDDAPRDRLGLAQWLVSENNPLTARVTVNRFWQMIFGRGIVETSEDFGSQGAWPSHPELLDWLAVEFRQSGWNVKDLLRLIVTSATYRQQSRIRPDLRETDPENRLLARFPRARLPAELIRDQALAASGLLVDDIGGPPVRPYQPPGLWRERSMLDSNTRDFVRDDGEDLHRRGLYTFWKRAAPPPQLSTFDAPEREFCVVRRSRTNTPLQALVLLNDETYLEIARALAQRVLTDAAGDEARYAANAAGGVDARHAAGESPAARASAADAESGTAIERAFRLVLARYPTDAEREQLVHLFRDALDRFAGEPEAALGLLSYGEAPRDETLDPARHAALTLVCSAILNLDETVTRR